MKLVSRKKGHI